MNAVRGGLDPYLKQHHRELGGRTRAFGEQHLRTTGAREEADPAGRTRELVATMAETGLLSAAVPQPFGAMDLRSLVVVREELAYHSSLADTAFVMQGLGSHVLSLAGTELQQRRWLPKVLAGELLCGFALTEPDAGSDLGGIRTRASRDGAAWRLDGTKTLISNAGIAGLYTVLARSEDREGPDGLSMFLVDGQAPGLDATPLEPMAPHPIGELRFTGTPAVQLGSAGKGYGLALATLDTFRPSVGAAACGLASRALDESLGWVRGRRQFGRALREFQATQLALAEMWTELHAARLAVRHAAWMKDSGAERLGKEGAAAKLLATETAQRVVDRAVQLHGGHGVMRGATVERLYREVRSLRIYEGTSEIQKLIVAKELLDEGRG